MEVKDLETNGLGCCKAHEKGSADSGGRTGFLSFCGGAGGGVQLGFRGL